MRDWTPRDLTDYRTRIRCWYEVRNGKLVDMLSPWERFKAWLRRWATPPRAGER